MRHCIKVAYMLALPKIILVLFAYTLLACHTEEMRVDTPNMPVLMNFTANLNTGSEAVNNPFDGANLLMFSTYGAFNDSIWHGDREIMSANQALLSSIADDLYEITFDNNKNYYYLADNSDTLYYFFRALHPTTSSEGVTFILEADTPSVEINLALQPDFIMAGANNIQKGKAPISLEFKHLLTKLSFYIEKEAGMSGTVSLEALTAEGHTLAVLYYPESFIRETSHRGDNHILTIYPKNGTSLLEVPSEGSSNAPLHVGDILVFPMSGIDKHYYEFRLTVIDNNLPEPDRERISYFRLPHDRDPNNPGAIGTYWAAGKRYQYKIRITDSSASVDIQVEDAGIDDWYWDGQVY